METISERKRTNKLTYPPWLGVASGNRFSHVAVLNVYHLFLRLNENEIFR